MTDKTKKNSADSTQVRVDCALGCCEWHQNDFEGSYYDTGCDHAFYIDDGTPADNEMNYCPFCGRTLKQVLHTGYGEE